MVLVQYIDQAFVHNDSGYADTVAWRYSSSSCFRFPSSRLRRGS
jgi:hypothetical protein